LEHTKYGVECERLHHLRKFTAAEKPTTQLKFGLTKSNFHLYYSV